MLFHVGQMVVCVDNGHRDDSINDYLDCITVGQVYTVSAVKRRTGGVHLEEVDTPPRQFYTRHRFRPVKETNIDVFRKLVAPTPEKETA